MLARDIANYISDENLAEGTKLPTEQEMVEQFGVGRNSIREALRLLEMRGVITIRSGRGGGPVVRLPRSSDLAEALQLILQFQHSTLTDVLDARLILEPLAASHAATNMTGSDLRALQRSVASVLDRLDDQANFIEQNNIFHSTIGRSLNSPVLGVFLDSLSGVQESAGYRVRYTPARRQAVAKAHQAIIDQLLSGDADRAAEAMRAHLADVRRHWTTKFSHVSTRPLRWLGD
jgi:DNA-binding FadR family transcriptional regulator